MQPATGAQTAGTWQPQHLSTVARLHAAPPEPVGRVPPSSAWQSKRLPCTLSSCGVVSGCAMQPCTFGERMPRSELQDCLATWCSAYNDATDGSRRTGVLHQAAASLLCAGVAQPLHAPLRLPARLPAQHSAAAPPLLGHSLAAAAPAPAQLLLGQARSSQLGSDSPAPGTVLHSQSCRS